MNTPFEAMAARLATTTYVILLRDNEGKLTLLADPGMGRPWSGRNKRLADFHARQCNGEARTWAEAFALLKKEAPNLEDVLYDRVKTAAMKGRTHKFPANPT